MPLNPNWALTGLMKPQPNMQKNVNPTGYGGTEGGLQSQPVSQGALVNSSAYRPQSLNEIGGPAGSLAIPYPAGQGGFESVFQQTLAELLRQNELLSQQLGLVGQGSGLESSILARNRELLSQERNARPTSGAYFFTGGL